MVHRVACDGIPIGLYRALATIQGDEAASLP